MPAVGYCKRTFTGPRPWEITDAAPFHEVPDLTRDEMRFAAEVALAELRAELVPTFAHERAMTVLTVLAH